MHFQDHEKRIYTPESRPDLKLDPLAVDRALTKASGGQLSTLLKQWQPVERDASGVPLTGDISDNGANAELVRAAAEEKLAAIAREVFGFKPFPESTDAEALEVLLDYLWWMEGKGVTAGTPPTLRMPTEQEISELSPITPLTSV